MKQPRSKKMSQVHTSAEVANEAEKDPDEINKEKKKKVEKMFVEEGWTAIMSKRRMKSRKVLASPWSEQCWCCFF